MLYAVDKLRYLISRLTAKLYASQWSIMCSASREFTNFEYSFNIFPKTFVIEWLKGGWYSLEQ